MAARSTRYKGIKRIAERTFHVRVTTTDLRTGKRKEKKLTVQGRIEDALEVRERLRQEIHDEAIVPTAERRRVGEYAQSWMKRKAFELSPATAERYATALDRHILPALGDYYYDMVRRDDVQDWVNSKLMEGYKVGTVNGWFRVFGTMTRDAMAELEFMRDPTLRIRFPTLDAKPKSEAITLDELVRFLRAMREDYPQHYALVVVLAFTGLRFCHASAFKWEDWDEARSLLHVRRSHERGRVSEVKRKKDAPRLIPLLPHVTETLRWHRLRMIREQAPGLAEGWMFPSKAGTLRVPSSVAKAFAHCRDRAGITARFTVHGMRYTFTDTLRLAEIDPIVRRELTGHHTERMQANYSTIRLDEHRHALSQVAELITAKATNVAPAVYREENEES